VDAERLQAAAPFLAGHTPIAVPVHRTKSNRVARLLLLRAPILLRLGGRSRRSTHACRNNR
jgi:hypothetical protein